MNNYILCTKCGTNPCECKIHSEHCEGLPCDCDGWEDRLLEEIIKQLNKEFPYCGPGTSDGEYLYSFFRRNFYKLLEEKEKEYKKQLESLLDNKSLKDKSNGRYNREIELRYKIKRLIK